MPRSMTTFSCARRLLALAALAGATAAASAQTANEAAVMLYEGAGGTGRSIAFSGVTAPTLGRFNDLSSSIVIQRGRWQLCSDSQFRGQCQIFGPGRYEFRGTVLDRALSSMRRLAADDSPLPAGPAIVLYQDAGLRGDARTITQTAEGLGVFNDESSSAEVLAGSWEVCTDARFEGQCRVLPPGVHSLTGRFADSVSSVRPTGGVGDGVAGAPRDAGVAAKAPVTTGPNAVAVVLFRDRNGAGPALGLNSGASSLADRNFNDGASSLQITRGRWEICSDANYGGSCRVYGPGRYQLNDLSNRVSSLRRVFGGDDRPLGEQGGVSVYAGPTFTGREVVIARDQARPPAGFTRITSVEVHEGRWEFCSDVDYGGRCVTETPGRYQLSGIVGQVRSIRAR